MIKNKDIEVLFKWGKNNFSSKHILIGSSGYWNKNVMMNPVKFSKGKIKKSITNKDVINALSDPNIITSFFVLVEPHSISLPHIDPPVYKERIKRIQIPLSVPKGEETFMIYKGEKFYWKEGVAQVFDVMNNLHEAQNLTDFPLKFLMLDVKFDCAVEFDQ